MKISTCAVMGGASVVAVLVAGCNTGGPGQAAAEIRDARGNVVGSARFEPAGDDVRAIVQVNGLAPGAHGIHVHDAGRCEPPSFESAGAHFDPGGAPHHGEGAHHAGDLPNLVVNEDGRGRLEAVLPGLTLDGRGHHSLFHLGGTSIVIHREEDDLKTAPSGNSGERIACGVIVASGD